MILTHPIALGGYIVTGIVVLLVVMGKMQGPIGRSSPTDNIRNTITTVQAIADVRASDSESSALRLAEVSRAIGMMQSIQQIADQKTIMDITGVDATQLLSRLKQEAITVGQASKLSRDDVETVWS